jgi:hypothetical protein
VERVWQQRENAKNFAKFAQGIGVTSTDLAERERVARCVGSVHGVCAARGAYPL